MRIRRFLAVAVTSVLFATLTYGAEPNAEQERDYGKLLQHLKPLPPEEALKSFKLEDGFTLQLVASEPNISDPTAAAFDEYGRLYVAEMRGYPYDPPPGGGPAGRVSLLEDLDGDGRYETRHLFADGVHWPSGFAFWKGGVFVSAPPDLWYMKDTDGDQVADVRERVFTGFGTDKSEDIMNNPRWGLDHMIYGVSSYNGGEIRSPDEAEGKGLSVRGRDYRFDPTTFECETLEGSGDFGHAFDDWGHRFAASSGTPIIHCPMLTDYIARNPYLAVERQTRGVLRSDGRVFPISRPEPWRVVRKEFWENWVNTSYDMREERFSDRELAYQGYVTGMAGLVFYRGTVYPEAYRGNAFSGEPAGNLVYRMTVEPDGAFFDARHATEGVEFIASTDNWFRPVNFTEGPDGCMYMCDMYREVIEDPSAIPADILEHIDYYTGQDLGRIYRIVPPGFTYPGPANLGDAKTEELVEALEHEQSWWRETAHRLIYERQEASAAPGLKRLVNESAMPQARLHALWTLAGLDQLDTESLVSAFKDTHPAVRENAVRIAERFSNDGRVRDAMLELVGDENVRVRYQLAFSLQTFDGPKVLEGLARLGLRDVEEGNIWTAILAAVPDRALALFMMLVDDAGFCRAYSSGARFQDLARIVGAKNDASEVGTLLSKTMSLSGDGADKRRREIVLGLAGGLVRSGGSLQALLDRDDVDRVAVQAMLADWFEDARKAVRDRNRHSRDRMAAIRILVHAPYASTRDTLVELFDASQPLDLQIEAVRGLSSFDETQVAAVLVENWRQLSPRVRGEVAEALVSRRERIDVLLDALENETIPLNQFDPLRRTALQNHPDNTVSERADAVFGRLGKTPRAEIVASYQPVLSLKGDKLRGEKVFRETCVSCHRAADQGHVVGPDLASVQNRSPEQLLISILDPNAQVQPNYVNYKVETADGVIKTGILVDESPTTITLRRAEGIEDVIFRKNIDKTVSMGMSIMPEGHEESIDHQEMADLIAFILSLTAAPSTGG